MAEREMERGISTMNPKTVELAKLIGQVEGAKKLSEQMAAKTKEPVITQMHSDSMQTLVNFLAINEDQLENL